MLTVFLTLFHTLCYDYADSRSVRDCEEEVRERMMSGIINSLPLYRNGVKNREPRDTAVGTVCRQIRRLILGKEFRAGQKLSEIGLSKQLEVSRTPVREALKLLASDGLLVLIPKSGVWVANPSKREVEDAYALRAKLESWATSMAVRNVTPLYLARLHERIQEAEVFDGEGDAERYLEVNTAFHMTIAEMSGNSILMEHIRMILDKTFLYMAFLERIFDPRDNLSLNEHIELLDAFTARDEALCVRLMENHVNGGLSHLTLSGRGE